MAGLSPEEVKVRDRLADVFMALAKKVSTQDVNPVDGPPTLYHYTTARGLIGILQDSTIWLSRAAALNDPREHAYGWEVAARLLQSHVRTLGDTGTDELLQDFYGHASQWVMGAVQHRPDWIGNLRIDPFVACFSSAGDTLSQWVYYTKEGGYCVGFQRDRLLSAKFLRKSSTEEEPQSFDVCPVIYDPAKQRQLVTAACREFEEKLIEQVWTDRAHWSAAAQMAAVCFSVAVGSLAARMKAPGFAPEKEWRMLTFAAEGGTSPEDPDGIEAAKQMRFRSLGGRIIPYLLAEYGPGKAPIVSVTSGPTVDAKLGEDSIRRLLKANGYPWRDIQISASGVSLRE